MKNQVFDWILSQRENGICVGAQMIKRRALIVSSDDEFVASNSCLLRFLKRKHLAIRRITTSGRDFPKKCSDIVESFIQECQNKLLTDSVDKN